MGVALLEEMITVLVGGISGISQGIGSGLNELVQSIFLTTTTGGDTTLSIYGSVILVFAGVGLAIGLSKLVVGWLTSLGN